MALFEEVFVFEIWRAFDEVLLLYLRQREVVWLLKGLFLLEIGSFFYEKWFRLCLL